MTKHVVLAINPGSTSTKFGIFENETELYRENIEHSSGELAKYKTVADQYDLRRETLRTAIAKAGFDVKNLAAVVGRGGNLSPLKRGAYRVNTAMLDFLKYKPVYEHASNLGAMLAYEIAEPLGIPSFIYDAVVVDEMAPEARLSGIPDIERISGFHVLNSRAVAVRVAKEINKPYDQTTLIVAHLGGGISVSIHRQGRMVDFTNDSDGAFSPERSGGLPVHEVIDLCFSGKYDQQGLHKRMRGGGGLVAYLGTTKAVEVEQRIAAGDEQAKLVYYAMAYQAAKCIGQMAAVAGGNIDRIVLTGGIAHSKMITGWISGLIGFMAPIVIIPGENELEALAFGGLRVLRGEEAAHEFATE